MDGFRLFVESNESDAQASIRKLPAKHRKLVRGFAIRFQSCGTLKGDGDHIGKIVDTPKKCITLAAPWFYPREFALLHEVGHLVWGKYVKGTDREKAWMKLYKQTKGKVNQNAEECFAHTYAQYYSHNKIVKHEHPAWNEFIKNLPK